MKKTTKKIILKSWAVLLSKLLFVKNRELDSVVKSYDFKGYKRVYLFHIRKTGGTSLNNMFLSLSGGSSDRLYTQLSQAPEHRIIHNDKVYVGWNVKHINRGKYFYAFSHVPFHKLSLPDETLTISCFRDPVKRVVSHYTMLVNFQKNGINHPCMDVEGKWIGQDFGDFLSRIPKEHLLNQLYMFSPNFDIDHAVCNVRKLSHFFFSDNFDSGIDDLNELTGLNLKAIHIRKANAAIQIPDKHLVKLREMLSDEYEFLERIRRLKKNNKVRC